MRVFFDTNVLVSGLVARGVCADLLRLVLAEHELVTSEFAIEELKRVLRMKFAATAQDLADAEALLRDEEVIATPSRTTIEVTRDPSDAWIVASAIAAEADVLVTGDRDLLELSANVPFPIVTPRGFWEMLRNRPANGA